LDPELDSLQLVELDDMICAARLCPSFQALLFSLCTCPESDRWQKIPAQTARAEANNQTQHCGCDRSDHFFFLLCLFFEEHG